MKIWNLIGLLVMVGLSLAIFGSILDAGPLTWDDGSNIFGNPYYTMHMWWGVWNEPFFGLYVPITSTVWAALYTLGHGSALPFRILNLALHVSNIVLVFLLLQKLSARWQLKASWAIGVALGVFALHPLQTQAIAWISGGRDLLAAFFALSATLLYYSRRPKLGLWLGFLLFAIGLLCKPNIVVLPLVLVSADVILRVRTLRQSVWRLVPWFFASAAITWMTHSAQVGHYEDKLAWYWRPWVMADTYFFYLQKLGWPFPLSGNYAHTPEKLVAHPGEAWKALVLVAAAAGASWWARNKDPRVGFGALWFLLLLPVSGIVPFGYENISGVADHYVYLPMVIVAALLLLLFEQLNRVPALALLPVLVIGGWCYATWNRLEVWESDTNFYSDMAKYAPESYNTQIGMAVVECQMENHFDAGVAWTEKALANHPNDILALADRAFCLLKADRPDAVIEMDYYIQNLDTENLSQNQPTAYSSFLASIGEAMFRKQEFEDGFQYFCAAYRVKPAEPNHLHNLQAGKEILKAHGLDPTCDQIFAPEHAD